MHELLKFENFFCLFPKIIRNGSTSCFDPTFQFEARKFYWWQTVIELPYMKNNAECEHITQIWIPKLNICLVRTLNIKFRHSLSYWNGGYSLQKKDGYTGACNMYGIDEKYSYIQSCSLKTWMKPTTWETKRRWKDDIKKDLVEVGYEDVLCIHLA
jgi:hypothetical protein